MKLIGTVLIMVSIVVSESRSNPDAKALPAAGPNISIEDVDRFYRIYDAAGGHPSADELQHDYIDKGSEGLLQFAKLRHITGTAIAETFARVLISILCSQ